MTRRLYGCTSCGATACQAGQPRCASCATDSKWCGTCGRIKGVGCACGLSFREKVKGVGATLPDGFRAAKG